MKLNQASLDYALGRIEDFHAVHRGKKSKELTEPLAILMDSLGLDKERTTHLYTWLKEFGSEGDEDAVLLGILIALIATNYDT